MSYPIDDLQLGDSIYCERIESDLIISSIVYKGDNFAIVRFENHDRYNAIYRLEYCYSSLAYGPHWLIDIEDYSSPSNQEEYYRFSNYAFEICVYN